ncbi:MAG: hypothetical protein JST00_10995 [Deltaproteobacteria bacterium]|nr:hypothetical protein [Deltaproteobacteria bacterium]
MRTLRRSRARRRASIVGALLAIAGGFAAAPACGPGAIDDLTRGRPDAGVAPEAEASAPDASVCTHATAPERPVAEDGPSVPNLTFALDDLRFDTGPDPSALPPPFGLDLDRTCTCPEAPSCTPRSDAAAAACDFDGGRDNVAGQLFYNVLTVTNRGDAGPLLVLREQIRRGLFTALFLVQGWNGKDDDPNVVASVVQSTGAAEDDDGGRIEPRFEGNDVWKADPLSLAGGENLVGNDCRSVPCVALALDAKAYVTGGVLVSNLDGVQLRLRTGSGPIVVDFIGATLVARITRAGGGGYRLQGEVTGRWPTDRILSSLSGVRDPITNKSLCPPGNTTTYELVKRLVCDSADLANDPIRDRSSATCNALSASITFSAVPAVLGKVESLVQDPTDCPGFTDSCDRK